MFGEQLRYIGLAGSAKLAASPATSSPSEQTDRQTPGRGAGDDRGLGGGASPCGGDGWHLPPGGLRVDAGGPWEQGTWSCS